MKESKSHCTHPDQYPDRLIKPCNNTYSACGEESAIPHPDEFPFVYPLREFETHALQHPDAIAAVFDGEQLTYKELNRRANQLGHFLRRKGIGPETVVGVYLERSLDLVIGILGVLKAGGAILPLEPSYPSKRITFMLNDGQPSIVLTHHHLRQLDSPQKFSIVCLDTAWKDIAHEDSTNLPSLLKEGHALAVFYTSGSTGNPKGVIEVHQKPTQPQETNESLHRRIFDGVEFDSNARVLVKCPISFAPSMWEILTPLTVGSTLVLAKPNSELDIFYLGRLISEERITIVHFVPSILRLFLSHPEVTQYTSLKHIICSGEILPEDVRQQFFSYLDTTLHYYYAATEAPGATILHMDRRNLEKPLTFNKGASTQVHVLSPQLEHAPVGIYGETYIESKGKIRGYLGRPALTAEKFIPDPLSLTPGARLYKTGDLSCYSEDGTIKLLGRRDFQIKLSGVRIELGEIESALRQQHSVLDAVVLCREDTPNEKQLAAYVIGTSTKSPDPKTLRRELQKEMPPIMIPSRITALETFPLTPNGKIDREALLAWKPIRPTLRTQFVAPRTLIEKLVTMIWEDQLKVKDIGIQDNFFELGGNSLLATRVITRIRAWFSMDLPLRILFEQPTVSALASILEQVQGPETTDELIRILDNLDVLSENEVRELINCEISQRKETDA